MVGYTRSIEVFELEKQTVERSEIEIMLPFARIHCMHDQNLSRFGYIPSIEMDDLIQLSINDCMDFIFILDFFLSSFTRLLSSLLMRSSNTTPPPGVGRRKGNYFLIRK
jgi:hypothetical protein